MRPIKYFLAAMLGLSLIISACNSTPCEKKTGDGICLDPHTDNTALTNA